MATTRWNVKGDADTVRDVAIDFLDGADRSLDELNARNAKVFVRATEVVITFAAGADDDWIVEAFSRRHPNAEVTVSQIPAGASIGEYLGSWRCGEKTI